MSQRFQTVFLQTQDSKNLFSSIPNSAFFSFTLQAFQELSTLEFQIEHPYTLS